MKFWKVLKKILIAVLALILCAALFVAGVRVFMALRARPDIEELSEITEEAKEEGPFDAVIVLGAGVYRDGSLSPMLRYRMETTVECFESGAVQKVFVTGDHRLGEYDEVDHMVEYLVEHGVPESAIEFDYNGFSTYESMVHAAREFGIRRAVVVTQKYHLYRAMFIGRANGMELRGLAAQNWRMSTGTVMRTVREWAACVKDLFYVIRQTEP
ncbi:MAG: YdcF family protein [Lachnospiraceae bacterium]|nr:YdcF family protein [Lachnospiraceae bacterium]